MDFKNVPNKYRPIPFWSWNEKLDCDETVHQIKEMYNVGIGGFFMHARGGLQTEYMGSEWFENVTAAKDAAKDLDMGAWAYDENGWPSGFGNGIVNGLGVEYQQKYLRMADSEPKENVIGKCGNHWFYFDINPFYVDVLDKKVTEKFIEVAYKPYYEKYKNEIEGFFTDEPQISRLGIPWSFVYDEEYKNRYGEDINEHLEELILPVGDYKNTRIKFWKMVTDLFSNNFMKPIYDQCEEWGLKVTGHLVMEDELHVQLTANGAAMPHYEYFHIPGMDWLGRNIFDCLTPIQVGSAAEQLGKKQVLSETFALCGHNISFAELKGMFEWQMVRGINLLCQHLEGYSNRGIRKRDYPPAMYLQQPWWSEYKKFNDAMSRVGMILAEGEKQVDVLVMHPMTTAWTYYSSEYGPEHPTYQGTETQKKIYELNCNFIKVLKTLEQKHINFHLGDETLMERHGKVENGKLVIGKQSYSYVVTTTCEHFLPNTERLLSEFTAAGGQIVSENDFPENNVVDNPEITYTRSLHDGFTAHYFVNTSPDRKSAKFAVGGKVMDIFSGELYDFGGTHEFEPWGSLMIIENGDATEEKAVSPATLVSPSGEFTIAGPVENSITLDYCDYYFDGELQEKNGFVLNIAERANALGKMVKIHQDYRVNIEYIPENLWLVSETPEKFTISVNGTVIEQNVCGYFRDKSFKKIEIAKYLKVGENTISFDCDFVQSDEFYEALKRAYMFETERNKLVYDMEIEAIYLLGDFSVKTDGKWSQLDKKAVRYVGDFVIAEPKKSVSIKNLEQQGFPFFSGELTIDGELDIQGENPVLDLDVKGVNAIRVEIGGKTKVMLTDNRLSLSDFGVTGKTKVRFTLINNLRNLLGPHHLESGECYAVCPRTFFKEACIWNGDKAHPDWNDDYCFVEMGI